MSVDTSGIDLGTSGIDLGALIYPVMLAIALLGTDVDSGFRACYVLNLGPLEIPAQTRYPPQRVRDVVHRLPTPLEIPAQTRYPPLHNTNPPGIIVE